MQHGDITITDNPFGVLQEFSEIKPVNDPDGAVASAGTDDRTDGTVVEHLLEIGLALLIGAGKLIEGREKMITKHYFQPPGFEDINGSLNFCRRDLTGRGNESDLVAFFEIWWCCHCFRVSRKECKDQHFMVCFLLCLF